MNVEINPYAFPGISRRIQLKISTDGILKKCNNIIDTTCRHFGIERDIILVKGKRSGIAKPRMIAIYLCAKDYETPLYMLSILFSRDHSTIIYNREECKNWMQTDKEFKKLVEEIKSLL